MTGSEIDEYPIDRTGGMGGGRGGAHRHPDHAARHGRPITLPVWFVVVDRTVCVSTPAGSKKPGRIRRDPRASFLVESGEEWRSLAAVHLSGTVHEETDDAARATIRVALDEKYRGFRVAPEAMPSRARDTYAQSVVLRLVPDGRLLSWDNRRLRLREE
jgi:Pyridoxamine 5'-phosphate oxidase